MHKPVGGDCSILIKDFMFNPKYAIVLKFERESFAALMILPDLSRIVFGRRIHTVSTKKKKNYIIIYITFKKII